MIINQHLTWHDHIEQLQNKIAKRLRVLKRIKHLLPVYGRRIYVSTMVIPDKNNNVLMDSVQVLQNKAAKLDRATHSSSTQALLDLNYMNLSTRSLIQRCFLCIILLMTMKETVWLLESQTIIAITPAPRKPLDLLDQTRTEVYSGPLIVHWQTGIPFQNTWNVYLTMILKFHYLKILNQLNKFS